MTVERKTNMGNIFSNNWNTPWSQVEFYDHFIDNADLGFEPPLIDAYAEPGNKNKYTGVEFGYVAYLTDIERQHDTDEEGWLTSEAMENLENNYKQKLSQYPQFPQTIIDSLRINDNFDQTVAHYNVYITIPYTIEGTVQEVFDNYVTPFYQTVQSEITNPI